MKDDYISKMAAIDALGEEPLVWHEDDTGEVAERNQWRRDVAAIKALPPAQPVEDARAMCGECDAWNQYKNYPQLRWILCKERMPENDGEYLVTIHWKNGGYYTDLLIYKTYLKEWKDEDKICGAVIAWMPKPKPWEGDANG